MKTEAIRQCINLTSDYNGDAAVVANEAHNELQALLDRIRDLENQYDSEFQKRHD